MSQFATYSLWVAMRFSLRDCVLEHVADVRGSDHLLHALADAHAGTAAQADVAVLLDDAGQALTPFGGVAEGDDALRRADDRRLVEQHRRLAPGTHQRGRLALLRRVDPAVADDDLVQLEQVGDELLRHDAGVAAG